MLSALLSDYSAFHAGWLWIGIVTTVVLAVACLLCIVFDGRTTAPTVALGVCAALSFCFLVWLPVELHVADMHAAERDQVTALAEARGYEATRIVPTGNFFDGHFGEDCMYIVRYKFDNGAFTTRYEDLGGSHPFTDEQDVFDDYPNCDPNSRHSSTP